MYNRKLPNVTDLQIIDDANIINLDEFKSLRKKLENVKHKFSKINLDQYYKINKKNNPYNNIIPILKNILKTENISNAFMKYYELLNYLPQYKNITAFFIAELPGSGIIATKTFCERSNIKFDWFANSYVDLDIKTTHLGDTYELLRNNPRKWLLGTFSDGDITTLDNIRSITQNIKYKNKFNDINLITADGADDLSQDYSLEEEKNYPIILGECLLMLLNLSINGNAFIKFFTLTTYNTINLLYMLCYYFESVFITKPVTSKSANSEIYVVCINRNNKNFSKEKYFKIYYKQDLFIDKFNIPETFLKELLKIETELINNQTSALDFALSLKEVNINIEKITNEWLTKYKFK